MSDYSMKPGRELDAMIAEKVMGWRDVCEKVYSNGERDWLGKHPERGATFSIQRYSTDANHAWSVVEKLRELHPDGWVCVLVGVGDEIQVSVSTGAHEFDATGVTLPHAICAAALKAFADTKDES